MFKIREVTFNNCTESMKAREVSTSIFCRNLKSVGETFTVNNVTNSFIIMFIEMVDIWSV